jgi:hypothetical protein
MLRATVTNNNSADQALLSDFNNKNILQWLK